MEKETALKILRERHAKALFSERTALETLIPELKESEDERIRREIISIVKSYRDSCITEGNHRFDNCIAWLEKQNEQLKIKQDMLITFRNSVPEEWDFSKDKDLKEEVDRCFHNGMFPKYITQYTTITVSDLMRCASHFYKFGKEHKPADKVEPNFREGDWIINNDKRIAVPTQILKIEKYGYVTSSGYTSFDKVKTDYHLWTIQDAKDGDVLTWDNSTCIALFKKIDNEYSFNSYGYVGHCTGMFETGHSCHDIEGSHPATKEQRDLLFQKMKEAGYEWDTEKRELKKVNV